MGLRSIITIGNPILRQRATKVKFFDRSLRHLAADMVKTMLAHGGVGLAAPQLGVSQRIIVVRLPDETELHKTAYGDKAGVLYTVVNPEIAWASTGTIENTEGCLSVPGYLGTVSRHYSIKVEGRDWDGEPLVVEASGWLACIFQHEIDHLDGVLFTDRASKVWPEDGAGKGPDGG